MSWEKALEELAASHNISPQVLPQILNVALNTPRLHTAFNTREIRLTEEGLKINRPTGITLITEIRKPVMRLILHELSKAISDIASVNEYSYWSGIKNQIVTGEIEKVSDCGYTVKIKAHTLSIKPIYACCPPILQPLIYRNNKEWLGKERIFYCSSVRLVTKDGISKTEVVLSLTSKKIPELILRDKIKNSLDNEPRVWCTKRYPGKLTIIESTKRLPKKIISETIAEIQEGLRVNRRNLPL